MNEPIRSFDELVHLQREVKLDKHACMLSPLLFFFFKFLVKSCRTLPFQAFRQRRYIFTSLCWEGCKVQQCRGIVLHVLLDSLQKLLYAVPPLNFTAHLGSLSLSNYFARRTEGAWQKALHGWWEDGILWGSLSSS